jgi:hypothetical protein
MQMMLEENISIRPPGEPIRYSGAKSFIYSTLSYML